ncbi:AAA family ATPase [Shewanella sp. UCD-KL12]|uniref:AAA family ATPase n=1 Tax=Shewanella sp. UCD-KL12 TaxID=1917163 RepID=UPI0009706ADD|nr:AAA family ATPase [Shewanella sp. UCD-KL12]
MLKTLSIKNFKSIDEENLKIAPLTILTGVNSTGKSTVIQAILLLLRFSIPVNRITLNKAVSAYMSPRDTRNRYTNKSEINIKLELNSEVLEHLSLQTRKDRDDNVIFRGGLKMTESLLETGEFDPAEMPLAYVYEPEEVVSNCSELFYLNATRLGPQTISEIGDFKVGLLGEHIFSTYDQIKNKALPKKLVKFSESSTIGYQVSQWLSEITDSKLELKTEKINSEQIKVLFNSDGLGELSPQNLGAGISYLAKVVILCFMAKKGDLVIIENPEIHLHPKSQAQLGSFLSFIASSGIQLIIETHSEHLIQKIRTEVKNETIECEDVIIHYKSATQKPFDTLYLDINGHYCDQEENRISFPKGFFDTSVDALLSLR